MNTFIPVNQPVLDGNEKKYLMECIDSAWISSEGPFVKLFEDQVSNLVGRQYGIAVSNGSAALDIAVKALNLGEGDEVIIPAFTIISCANAVVRAGATPVLVDADPITWNMNVREIEKKISGRTKAIMVVHIYGLPVDMDRVIELAHKYNLRIIEDAAEVVGQTYKQRPCGSFGDISTFSFYPNKHITTGEGGMLVCNDLALAERSKSLRNLCFQPARRFVHKEMGWNYRMTNLQAALGVAQLERLPEFVLRKRAMGKKYTKLLAMVEGLELMPTTTPYAENIYWVFGVVLKDNVPFDAEEAMRRLEKNGIGTRPFFWPIHEQPVYQKMGLFREESYPVSERIARRGFYLPSGLALTKEQILRVVEEMQKLLRGE